MSIRDETIVSQQHEIKRLKQLWMDGSAKYAALLAQKNEENEKLKAEAARHHLSPVAEGDELTISDYKEVFEDHKRLVRELDVIINGNNAAKQASLCDLVSQMSDEYREWQSEHPSSLTGDAVEFKKALQDIQQACVENESIEAARLSEEIATNALK